MCTSTLIVILTLLVTVKRKIACIDYNGNHRETYESFGKIQGLKVVNNIAYYVTFDPKRYYFEQTFVCMLLAHGSVGVMHPHTKIVVGFGMYTFCMM